MTGLLNSPGITPDNSSVSSLSSLSSLLLRLCVWIVAVGSLASCASSSRAAQAAPATPINVLFIGNSYTYGNDLPALLAELMARGTTPRSLVQQSVTVGGATLERHVADGAAVTAIRSRHWDYVVLQEQSARPFKDREAMFRAARVLHAEIRSAGATTLLYQTWAAQSSPQEQPVLSEAYRTLAKELGAVLVPVGDAWREALLGGMALHGSDGRHPNLHGSYLAACVFARALGMSSATTLPVTLQRGDKTITLSEAEVLQRCADQAWVTR
jgi:hypothetical protein